MDTTTIPVTGAEEAKKKPPKLIEKVIEKMEEVLASPASQSKGEERPKQQTLNPEQAQEQGSLGGNSEYVLPKGTTITLPEGNSFETQTGSKIVQIKKVDA